MVLLIGCHGTGKKDTSWQNLKIGEIAPVQSQKGPGGRLASIKTINFTVFAYQIPADNITMLDGVWKILYKTPLRFNNYKALKANSFSVGLGQIQMWNKIDDFLKQSQARKIREVSVLIPDGQTDDFPVSVLGAQQNIFYVPAIGSMDGVTIGPGKLALRIRAKKISGLRGVCNVNVLPIFVPPTRSSIPAPTRREKSDEVAFKSVSFGLTMSPGQFVFLGPEKYISHQMSLARLFFTSPGARPAFTTYLILCTRISD